MKVERSSSLETSSRHRRQERVVCMEFTVRANEDGDEEEKVAAAGREYGVSTSAGRESSNLTVKEGEGLYKLTRHKSAVFEHDFRHYANSLNRTSSEVRALPLQLGLQAHDQKDCRKDLFGIGDTEALAVTVESQKSDNKELLSHSPSLKIGQLEKFVYKNYSLHGRRTASLPVGKEHAHKLHSGQSWKGQGCKEGTATTSSSFTSNGLLHVQSRKQQRELVVTQENDFDKEAEKRSKSLLFFQGVHTLLTIAITLLTMYLCICFLTSVPRITAARYNTPANGSGQGEEEEEDSDFSHARLFARASSSLLTVDSANFQRKVLLVEDTRINRIILQKVLQNLNLQCDEAENGQVAVDYYKQGKSYDLVLMDKEMPVMDGHEATRQLRLMGVKTPIIALTGNALQSDRDLFFEAGVDDFQTKPLSRDKLVQLLVRYGVENSCSKLR